MLWITAALAACFLGIKWGLRDAPLLWFAALRALLGGGALALVALFQRRQIPSSFTAWAKITALGLVNVTFAFAAMFAGVAGLSTGVAAVLANAQPLLILLPAWWLFGERITARTGLALGTGFAGLLIVSIPGGGGSGALLSLLAAAAVTAGTLMVRGLADLDVVVLSAAHFLIGGLVLAGVALTVEGPPAISWTPRFVIVLAFLGLVATAATTLAWFVEAQRSRLSSLTVWMFLIPVFGLLIGIVVLGERPTAWTGAGIALVLASMWEALTKQPFPHAGPPGHLNSPGPDYSPPAAKRAGPRGTTRR
ncbi:DMT family transporter [Dietzia sp. PP-33]|jgi:drug/metabolite transporter (DMT)-like permease|uniref:DMT family transporter n=2 Tax=unclassified Dietzia TaxID=2617939 RepID=UPI0029A25181|nr:DMT family transporter [Dietzia sp. PP-33]MDX2356031.1 DMT family transporter [Dietzia sp. PP-33]